LHGHWAQTGNKRFLGSWVSRIKVPHQCRRMRHRGSTVIIELFGPAGSGKTTFAHALRRHLQVQGYVAEVMLSYEPGVHHSQLDPGGFWYALHRVAISAMRTAVFVCRPIDNAKGFRLTAKLIRILAPRNPIWLIRFSQYLMTLSHVWHQPHDARQIVIFDQGFIQLVSSLGQFSGVSDAEKLRSALALIPPSHLAIATNAAEPLLSKRLSDRLLQQTYMERLFEADCSANLRSIPIIDQIKNILIGSGRYILSIDTSDESSLQEGVARVAREIGAAWPTCSAPCSPPRAARPRQTLER